MCIVLVTLVCIHIGFSLPVLRSRWSVCRVIVMRQVVDSYPRGQNHFRVSGYDFAFRTFLREPVPGSAQASSEDANVASSVCC